MIEGSLSRRYTKALFQLAREGGQEDTIGREIEEFYQSFSRSDLEKVLTNPTFGIDSRKSILVQVTKSQQLSLLTTHFLSLLLERDRLTYLSAILSCYRRLLNEAKGRVEAKVVGASRLETATVERLREVLHGISGKEVVLHQEIDPGLIGGLLVELAGKVYDGSVRTQLEKMKERITRVYR
jgi:F-type H+-transporting ATPase subunit delta